MSAAIVICGESLGWNAGPNVKCEGLTPWLPQPVTCSSRFRRALSCQTGDLRSAVSARSGDLRRTSRTGDQDLLTGFVGRHCAGCAAAWLLSDPVTMKTRRGTPCTNPSRFRRALCCRIGDLRSAVSARSGDLRRTGDLRRAEWVSSGAAKTVKKKPATPSGIAGSAEPPVRLELTTYALRKRRSTN